MELLLSPKVVGGVGIGGNWRRSSAESSALKGRQHVSWYQNPVFLFQTRRTMQPLLAPNHFLTSKQKYQKVLSYHNKATNTIEARSIEEVYDSLAECLLHTATKMHDPSLKYLVGLAGPPGAGKTTLAAEVVRRLNILWPQNASETAPADVAMVLPMDGFHLYRSQLDAMENPEEAHARRGAPWTFDPVLLLKCLQTLRTKGSVYAPSFDHGVGDPVKEDIFVGHHHRVVIVEGNYLFLEEGAWKEISSIFNEKWFLDINIDTAMQRLLKRHISTGKAPDVAKWRIDYNDRPNAELILKSKKNADFVISSVDWKS